ncbi:MAG: Rieske 2Fe-2S domain-containing protein [Bacteroidetes bacterium]|nr:Rieske 2Fe-2S domain-containing protein [Bacteroidota bacterium]
MADPAPSESRRKTLKLLLGSGATALGAAIVYPIIAYLKPPEVTGEQVTSVLVGKVDDFAPGSGSLFRFGNKPGILLRFPNGSFKAFSATCTHLDCTVQYREDMGLIWCACHNGKYDLNGKNIDGPPPRPLDPFEVVVKGDEVHVTKS